MMQNRRNKNNAQLYWFALLFWSVCFEGLGRKYLPSVPSVAFYLLKDVILVVGALRFSPAPLFKSTAKQLYSGFPVFWLAAFLWTTIEIFNPEHTSLILGLLGMRAYWLWWLAPILLASVLQDPTVKRRAIILLSLTAVVISVFGAVQFVSPSTSAVNLYSVVNGEEVYANTAIVTSTGRARVASTFSYISGFSAFTILIPTLLLSIGMATEEKSSRKYALTAMAFAAAVLPMTGSRGSMLLGVGSLALTAWTAGLFFTKLGRRVMIGVVAGTALSVTLFPDAFLGVQSRFENQQETSERLYEIFDVVPIVSLLKYEYPIGGIGTGMQQNARVQMGIASDYNIEGENGRYLVEIGPIGYLTYWAAAKLGLCVALMRCARILKRANRRPAAAAAVSYAALALLGNLAFDHVWQAFFFIGCGFILSEVVTLRRQQAEAQQAAPPPSGRVAAVAVSR